MHNNFHLFPLFDVFSLKNRSSMKNKIFSQIFAATSIWMLIPGVLALSHNTYTFALSLFACCICSFKHWTYVFLHFTPSKFWHNLDRLCVILIFIQLNECTISFMLLLMFLFFTGAVLQKIAKSKYNTALRGQAEVLQFFVHLLARYLAFFACCWQTGHFRHNSWIFFFVICLCSILC